MATSSRFRTALATGDHDGKRQQDALAGFDDDADLHIMMNMPWDGLDFELPARDGRAGTIYPAPGRTIVVMISKEE